MPNKQNISLSASAWHLRQVTQSEDYLQNPEKQAQVKALEREIDRMVYKLYGLSEDEINIVEVEKWGEEKGTVYKILC